MATWVQEVEVDRIVDGGAYFIAIRPKTAMAGYLFWSRGLNGKERWASKPGIAIRGGFRKRKILHAKGRDATAVRTPD